MVVPGIRAEIDALAGCTARSDKAPLKVHQIVLIPLRDHHGHGYRSHRRVLLQACCQWPVSRVMGKNTVTRKQSSFNNREQSFPFSKAAPRHIVDEKTRPLSDIEAFIDVGIRRAVRTYE